MNVERLHALALAVRDDLNKTSAVATLSKLKTALQNQVSAPQPPEHAKAVANHYKQLLEALAKAPSDSFPPTWRETLEELGIHDVLGSKLASQVQEIFERNQITPSIALEAINSLHQRLSELQGTLEQLLNAFTRLRIGTEKLEAGEAEIGVLIPRKSVDNSLARLGEELEELNKILIPFVEVANEGRPDFKIRSIGSCDFAVFVASSFAVGAIVAKVVEFLVLRYKDLLDIRKLRGELFGKYSEKGLSEKELEPLDLWANRFMSEGIEDSVDQILTQFNRVADPARTYELRMDVRRSMTKLAGRIDHGYSIDVRMGPVPTEPGEDATRHEANKQYFDIVQEAAPKLQFLKPEGPPILSLPENTETAEAKDTKESKKDGTKKKTS